MGALAIRDENRISRAERAERTGKKRLPSRAQVKNKKTQTRNETLPIKPYRLWLEHLTATEARRSRSDHRDPLVRVAEFLDYSTRRLYHWMHEARFVDYVTVDRAATEHGGTTPEEIYRTYGNGTYFQSLPDGSFAFVVNLWAPPRNEQEVAELLAESECHSPGCRLSRVPGGRFCDACSERLARVKAEFDREATAFRSRIRRKGATSTCCNPACKAPRLAAERFCDACTEAGWSEENYE